MSEKCLTKEINESWNLSNKILNNNVDDDVLSKVSSQVKLALKLTIGPYECGFTSWAFLSSWQQVEVQVWGNVLNEVTKQKR